jgi:hypothetical protein
MSFGVTKGVTVYRNDTGVRSDRLITFSFPLVAAKNASTSIYFL